MRNDGLQQEFLWFKYIMELLRVWENILSDTTL